MINHCERGFWSIKPWKMQQKNEKGLSRGCSGTWEDAVESGKGQGRILRREDFCPSWGWKDWPEGGQRNSGKQSFQEEQPAGAFLLAGVPEIIHSWCGGEGSRQPNNSHSGQTSVHSSWPEGRSIPPQQPVPSFWALLCSASLIPNLWPHLSLAGGDG